MSKPSDLLPELQGRFPIRVRMDALTEADFVRILKEPRGALTKQYVALMAAEGVELVFTDDGIDEIARVAAEANSQHENIGARRLGTVMERVLEEVSFEGPALKGQCVVIDRAYVFERVDRPARGPRPGTLRPVAARAVRVEMRAAPVASRLPSPVRNREP